MNTMGFGSESSAGFPAAQRQAGRSRWQRWFQRVILCFGSGLALIGLHGEADLPVLAECRDRVGARGYPCETGRAQCS